MAQRSTSGTRRGLVAALAISALVLLVTHCGNDPLPRGPNERPVASLLLPDNAQAGEPVRLDGSTSADRDGLIVQYRFTPGDGSATQITADTYLLHIYAEPGIYPVTLTVVDDRGGKDSVVESLTVD